MRIRAASSEFSEFNCPHCAQCVYVDDWEAHGEYNDPQDNEYILFCPTCNERFVLRSEVSVNYTTRK